MSFQLSDWWKDLITKLLLLYSVFKIGGNVYAIFQVHFTLENPLIPDYFKHYTSFPSYFLIPIWLIIGIISWRLIKREGLLKKWFYVYFIGTLIYIFFVEALLFQLLHYINPYG
ncbi:MAG: hypothetical protein KTR22_12205 [Flavobacteriaceae bacterium]|nr:hypothetical protein [Flavobacteriaceae bacterium]